MVGNSVVSPPAIPIDFVQDHLGHRSIESSLVYARVSDRRRTKTIRRLERSREIAVPI
jgi:integrase